MNTRVVLTLCLVLTVAAESSSVFAADKDTIEIGDTIAGSIDVAGETDEHTFVGEIGDVIIVRLAEVTPQLYPSLLVAGPHGYDSWAGHNFTFVELLIGPLEQSGVLDVYVSDHEGTGTGEYRLHVQRVNGPVDPVVLHPNDTVAGELSQPAATQVYLLNIGSEDRILLRMAEDEGSHELHPEIRIYHPGGAAVFTGEDNIVAEINGAILPESETYTILVADHLGTTFGDYWLHCQRLNNPASATAINYGQSLVGGLANRAETDAFTFSGANLERLVARLVEIDNDTELLLRLYDPLGDQVTGASGFTKAELPLTMLEEDGTYTLLVMDSPGTDIGGYSLHIQCTNNPSGAGTLLQGATTTGTVGQPAATRAYRLAADAGDRGLFRMVEGEFDYYLYPELRLYRPDGTLVADNHDDPTAGFNALEMPVTGVYTLLAMDYIGSNAGDFWLYWQCLNDLVSATPVSYGQTLSGTLGTRAEADVFTFTGDDLDLVLARLVETDPETEPLLRLYGPDGNQITGASHFTLAELPLSALPGDGTYSLVVMDSPGTDIGGYSLHLQCINNPADATELAYGATVTGSVDPPARSVAYTLNGIAGDRVLMRAAEGAATTEVFPEIRIYRPDGELVVEAHDNTVAAINTAMLPISATYTVLLLDYLGTGVGDCWLHSQCTNDPVGAVLLEYGDTYDSELEFRTETDAFRFTGAAEDTFFATMTELDFQMEPLMRLYDPDGTQIAGDADFDEALISDLHLPVDGVYTLLAMDSPGTDTGPYQLNMGGGSGASAVPDQETPDLSPVLATALHGCSPNPFNPQTTIRFSLARAGRAEIVVYEMTGRLVVVLVDQIQAEGDHSVVWNGKDAGGRNVPSGAYIVRLETGTDVESQKISLIR